ncbi:serine hydrolase domain-containing protein [Streptomyces sp. FXJ1.4098]|nr:serine hydrolase domain-containing protein [Streptomyces sp. FXJ1.4098]
MKASRQVPRTGEPGEKFTYSNTNYLLLGLIIEKATGRSLAAELTRRLFAPLGMTHTYLPTRPLRASRARTRTATTPTTRARRATWTGRTQASVARPEGSSPHPMTSAPSTAHPTKAGCCPRTCGK